MKTTKSYLVILAISLIPILVLGQHQDEIRPQIIGIDSSWVWINLESQIVGSDLNESEIYLADSLLKEAVRYYNHNLNNPTDSIIISKPILSHDSIDIQDYIRQFAPYIDTDGDKQVIGNCCCAIPPSPSFSSKTDGLSSPCVVSDGYECWFQVRLNLTKRTVHDFVTN